MNFTPNWRAILSRAWSVRLMALAAILSGIEVVFEYHVPDWPPGVFAAVSGLVSAAALLSRVVAQADLEES